MVDVKEHTVDELKRRLESERTSLNKLVYLESAIKQRDLTFEMKRFILGKLAEFYEERLMYDKAGRALANKAGIDISYRDKIETYLKAAELFAKSGRLDESEDMFVNAERNSTSEQKQRIKLARKNILLVNAHYLEKQGKRASALKFYEKLIKMDLDLIEKKEVKDKLLKTYKQLGKFREAALLEGI